MVREILMSYGAPLFLRYQLTPPPTAPKVVVNAFNVLMRQPVLQWPAKVAKGTNAKLDLKADFQTWLEEEKIGWLAGHVDTHGAPFINTMAEALWYVDGHHQKLHARSCAVPELLQRFSGYNRPEKHGHKLPTLSHVVLKSLGRQVHAAAGASTVVEKSCFMQKCVQPWSSLVMRW